MSEPLDNPGDGSAVFPRLFRPRLRRSGGLVDAVPFVNVLLVIALAYLVKSPFVLQPGVRIELPEAPFTDGAAFGAIVVTVTQEGMIFFDDQRTTLDGLDTAFQAAAFGRKDVEAIIEADGQVSHRTLVEIYNKAMAAGIRRLSLATRLMPTEGEAER
jgi:biopolymer transport protein ExbD